MDIYSTVFCSGFWSVGNNAKRDVEHYKKLLPETIKMLSGGRLVFYYAEEWVRQLVEVAAKEHDVAVEFLYRRVQELPMRGKAIESVARAKSTDLRALERKAGRRKRKEKGLKHYHRELKASGASVYEDLLSIWFSKVFLVSEVAEDQKYDDAAHYAWLDASVTRFSGQRQNWNFIDYPFLDDGRLYHYPSKLRYQGRPLPLNASFLLGDKSVWNEVCASFLCELEELSDIPYPHDEETILGSIWYKRRKLFKSMDDFGYRKARLEAWRIWCQAKVAFRS